MSKRTNNQARRNRRKQDRATTGNEWAGYQLGDAIVGGPAFNPMTGQFDFEAMFSDPGALQVIGNPANASSEPTMREATLEDCVDDCPICMHMREQILAGNPPQVLAFD